MALGASVMTLRHLHDSVALKIDAGNSSFWAARHNPATDGPSLGLMERQRLKMWIQNAYEGFAKAGA